MEGICKKCKKKSEGIEIMEQGITVCVGCGTVIEDVLVDDNIKTWETDFMPNYFLKSNYLKQDVNKYKLDRLRVIFKILTEYVYALNLKGCENKAFELVRSALEKGFFNYGKTSKYVSLAAIYMVAKQEQKALRLDDFLNLDPTLKKSLIGVYYRKLSTIFKDGTEYKPNYDNLFINQMYNQIVNTIAKQIPSPLPDLLSINYNYLKLEALSQQFYLKLKERSCTDGQEPANLAVVIIILCIQNICDLSLKQKQIVEIAGYFNCTKTCINKHNALKKILNDFGFDNLGDKYEKKYYYRMVPLFSSAGSKHNVNDHTALTRTQKKAKLIKEATNQALLNIINVNNDDENIKRKISPSTLLRTRALLYGAKPSQLEYLSDNSVEQWIRERRFEKGELIKPVDDEELNDMDLSPEEVNAYIK